SDVEIDEVAQPAGLAEHQFGTAGRGCVILQMDRKLAERLYLGADVEVTPFFHDVARSACRVGPAPQFERHGNAGAGYSPVLRRGQGLAHFGNARSDEGDRLAWLGIAVGMLLH